LSLSVENTDRYDTVEKIRELRINMPEYQAVKRNPTLV